MAARNFLPRCTAFFNRIPMESLKICYSNAVHLGKKFLAAIFSAIHFLCLIDSPIPKMAGYEDFAGLLSLLLQKAEGLADFEEILDFICRSGNEATMLTVLRVMAGAKRNGAD